MYNTGKAIGNYIQFECSNISAVNRQILIINREMKAENMQGGAWISTALIMLFAINTCFWKQATFTCLPVVLATSNDPLCVQIISHLNLRKFSFKWCITRWCTTNKRFDNFTAEKTNASASPNFWPTGLLYNSSVMRSFTRSWQHGFWK